MFHDYSRRYPLGAEVIGDGRTHFRVWAPKARRVDVVLETSADEDASRTFHPLDIETGGYRLIPKLLTALNAAPDKVMFPAGAAR